MQKTVISINANSSLPSRAMSPNWTWSIIEEWRWRLRWWSCGLSSGCIVGGCRWCICQTQVFWNDTTSMVQTKFMLFMSNCQWKFDIWHHHSHRLYRSIYHLVFHFDAFYPQIPPGTPAVAHHRRARLQDWAKRPSMLMELQWVSENDDSNFVLEDFYKKKQIPHLVS